MPMKPKIPCRNHNSGCAALVDPADKPWNKGYCPRCLVETNRQYDRFHRDQAAKALYASTRWRKARKSYLARHPICVTAKCGKPATEVDHVIPHHGDPELFWDPRNWQGMCKRHHSAKTAEEDGGFGNR